MNSPSTPFSADDRLTFRVSEAATLSGLSRSTLYNLMKSGKLKTIKIGNCRLIRRDDLLLLLAQDKPH